MSKIKLSYEESHRIIDGITEKLCNRCFCWYPMNTEYYYKNSKNSIDGYFPYCKNCNINKMYRWRENHPEYLEKENNRTNKSYHNDKKYKQRVINNSNNRRINGKHEEWQRKNPSKLKQYAKQRQNKNHNITKSEWKACKEYFNYSCAYCGLSITEHYIQYRKMIILGDFNKEHVKHDGSNKLNNCVPSCKSCNSKKYKHLLEEWYNRDNPNYTEERYNKIIKWTTEDYKQFKK
jgi:hypothetical protein